MRLQSKETEFFHFPFLGVVTDKRSNNYLLKQENIGVINRPVTKIFDLN